MSLIAMAGPGSRFYSSEEPPPSGDKLFVLNPDDLNANGSNLYNFETRAAQSGPGGGPGASDSGNQHWTHTHLPTGGKDGGGAIGITFLAGEQQYACGFTLPANAVSWQVGDSVFIQIRVKFANDYRFPAGEPPDHRVKFFLLGSTSVTPQSRTVLFLNPPYDQNGGLANRDYGNYEGVSNQVCLWARPSYYGLSGANDWSDMGGLYGSIHPVLNIDGYPHCGKAVCLTHGNNASPPVPGPNGAAPDSGDCWYSLQFEIKSGTSGNVEYRTWVNNNDVNNPDAERTGITGFEEDGLGVTGWNSNLYLCGYVDTPPDVDRTIYIDRCEMSTEFDATFYEA